MLNNDPQITELDLDAYVDNQLTDAQRSEVEAHLSRHPEAAARVMRDLALHRDRVVPPTELLEHRHPDVGDVTDRLGTAVVENDLRAPAGQLLADELGGAGRGRVPAHPDGIDEGDPRDGRCHTDGDD